MKLFLIFISLILLCSFSKPPSKDPVYKPKERPEFKGETDDPEIQDFISEYKSLAKNKGIIYKNIVSIGFSSINRGPVIGTCTYGADWREITIDIGFWEKASFLERKALFFHESSHCYCTRRHDFDKDKGYEENTLIFIIKTIVSQSPFSHKLEGYFEDTCPLSIMYPSLVDEKCFKDHYDHYIEEMFERCEPF